MARGRYRGGKPTGRRNFSSADDLAAEDAAEASGVQPGDLPPSDSDESSSEDEGEQKRCGVAGLIETANPNAPKSNNVKAKNADMDSTDPQLTRRERELIEAQQSKDRYWKLHAQGKTDEAKKDLERLQKIKAEREAAALKRKEEAEAKSAAGKK